MQAIEIRNSSIQLIHDKTLHTHFQCPINQMFKFIFLMNQGGRKYI